MNMYNHVNKQRESNDHLPHKQPFRRCASFSLEVFLAKKCNCYLQSFMSTAADVQGWVFVILWILSLCSLVYTAIRLKANWDKQYMIRRKRSITLFLYITIIIAALSYVTSLILCIQISIPFPIPYHIQSQYLQDLYYRGSGNQ